MNKQEIFDKVYLHAQLKQKSNDGAQCLFRGPGGTKCFVGCLIEDDDYDPAMEEGGLTSPLLCQALGKNGVDASEDYAFLVRLQRIHDHSEPDRWNGKLHDLADEWDLTCGR